jgi:hydroxyacylglutathione hydrolase
LIAESENEVLEGRMRLARVGLEGVGGYLKDGVSAWAKGGLPLSIVPQIGIDGLRERFRSDRLQVLDVRREAEWKAGHIENALWWPLDNFRVSPPEIDRDRPVAVHCKSGYRSMIACSLLQRAGFADVRNVAGGFDAWEHAKLPVVVESTINA